MTEPQSLEQDPNWMFDPSGKPIPIGLAAIFRYFERAAFAFASASKPEAQPPVRAMLTAFCVHGCQSLREALQRIVDVEPEGSGELRQALADLPFAALINDVRQHDIHGHPLPACEPGKIFGAGTSRAGSPVNLSCSQGAGIQLQMIGAEPVVTKIGDPQSSKLSPGQTISYQCVNGELGVWDYRTQKTYKLLGVLEEFLSAAHQVVLSIGELHGVTLANS